jgi:hypothetical protein
MPCRGYRIRPGRPATWRVSGRSDSCRLTGRGEQFCLDAAIVINEVKAEWAERLGHPHPKHLRLPSLHTLINDTPRS